MADLTLEEWNSIYGRVTAALGSELSLPQRPSSVEQLAAVVGDLGDRVERLEQRLDASVDGLWARIAQVDHKWGY